MLVSTPTRREIEREARVHEVTAKLLRVLAPLYPGNREAIMDALVKKYAADAAMDRLMHPMRKP